MAPENHEPIVLRGTSVALTGRFASMAQDEIADLIERHGGTFVRTPSRTTHYLVVGQDGAPLNRDGEPTENLLKAQSLQERGYPIVILGEHQFLEALGEGESGEFQGLYTVFQLSRFLRIPTVTIRAWIRRGLLRPVRTHDRIDYFSFQQVAAIKMLRELMDRGLTSAQLGKSLRQIEAWLPEATESLAQLGLVERDGEVLVRLDDGRLADSSGQLSLFGEEETEEAELEVAEAESPSDASARISSMAVHRSAEARDWFDHGVELEEQGDLDGAVDAYRNALRVAPDAETAFSLGNALYEQGDRIGARAEFERAIELDPESVEAWNNLGSLYVEDERYPEAIAAYRNALEVAPDYPDANYNLAEALLAVGDTAEASRHALRYFRYDPTSTWAQRLRDELARACAS
ncbi:MAG: tetratricopeptide repeat protein [Planctomycetota bacterium]